MKHICKKRFNVHYPETSNDEYQLHYTRVVASGRRVWADSDGRMADNELYTQVFDAATPIETVMKWAWKKNITGDLTITIDESSENTD